MGKAKFWGGPGYPPHLNTPFSGGGQGTRVAQKGKTPGEPSAGVGAPIPPGISRKKGAGNLLFRLGLGRVPRGRGPGSGLVPRPHLRRSGGGPQVGRLLLLGLG